MADAEKKIIFVTVEDGLASVDESTVPEGFEVRILDFDSLENSPEKFNDELDDIDRTYLEENWEDEYETLQSLLNDDDGSNDEEEEEDDDDVQ